MRSTFALTTALLLLVAATSVRADLLLWDNYPGDVLQDPTVRMSSERNTQIVESTWVIDDVELDGIPGFDPTDLLLTQLTWVGARNPDYTYGKADVILLDPDFNTLSEMSDLDYTFTDFNPDPDSGPDWQTYTGELLFDPPIPAVDLGTHFYIGVRLVGDGYFDGRNTFVTSSIDLTLNGQTEGYTKGAVFGAPDWRPASDVWFGGMNTPENFEFAFRLFGIPEPASIGLLLVGAFVWLRRR